VEVVESGEDGAAVVEDLALSVELLVFFRFVFFLGVVGCDGDPEQREGVIYKQSEYLNPIARVHFTSISWLS